MTEEDNMFSKQFEKYLNEYSKEYFDADPVEEIVTKSLTIKNNLKFKYRLLNIKNNFVVKSNII
ncbi:MAG: hypothetical protein PHV68_04695 [Candidatus Gastranaerophilales bacterium]|nr:hypothetical protein [Candidatus Gastranaerophilales bacterium]